ncbi:hypothetical protein E3N88_04123 [Mikania micrantha]|uniref:F-box domain-containing protein n=1 Tax=Mikania micrantha TaxID=192012 RepID=A0A5N6PTI4_9ASTR|nr:hypothetical protein E3N88_04123 [Mikania micrantha]
MSSIRPDLTTKIHPHPPYTADHSDLLPDPLLLLIFNKIGDVKTLGRCSLVSKRFQTLIPQVQNVVVRVDCVISDDDPSGTVGTNDKSGGPFSSLIRLVLGGIVKPIQAIGQFLGPNRSPPSPAGDDATEQSVGVTHHSPTQVLKNFNEIRVLKIELPTGELGIEDDVLLKWRADFGSTLDNCVILGASSIIHPQIVKSGDNNSDGVCGTVNDDNGSIPESFYTNGGLKVRVVWTISSLIAASARHYLLQPIISEHKTLESLVLTDAETQGVLFDDQFIVFWVW